MTSNMLSGERRWASAKRGGMTVLGKIVVPKPINLPSQKSENHGLDPNVEIVPKGTLTWGSKSSSPWGSVSPNMDGGSPSHLIGRPSSGSGTRPSTASSDRALDLSSNSRPASASGALTTNQTSLASLRPRSAETRPGSSQLSRFAENSEHPAGWNVGAAEKLGVTSSKNDEFSLTSGDFPTLGSGKESGKKADLQDPSSYGRPGSSSGGVGTPKEVIGASGAGDSFASENAKNGTVNSWRRDNPPYSDDGGRPGSEKWHVNPQTYPGPPPQHYDAWHGAPVHNPQGGGWFRGGPPGGPPPYGNQVGPGGYPMEPYPYYRPQIPASGLPNSQPVPLPVAGPRGPHPKNGDMYRPHMPDHYIRPGIVRPGFYPGPVSYEGYYNPPMGYCGPNGPNDRDVQYMGIPAGPPPYNRYPVQGALEPGNHQGRSGGYGQTNQGHMGEQAESGHSQDHRGPYKVLLKHPDGWDWKNEEHRVEDDWRSDRNKEGERDLRKEVGEETSFQTFDNQGSGSVPPRTIYPRRDANPKAVDDISGKKLESESFVSSKDPQPLLSIPKDSSLIQKIEGLNAKARASDGLNEIITVPEPERQNKKFHANTKANYHIKESGGGSVHTERTPTGVVNPISHEGTAFGGDKNSIDLPGGAGANISRKPTQSRADHHGRGRFNTQELDGRQNKPLISQPPVMVPVVRLENSNILLQDHHRPSEVTGDPSSRVHGKPDGQSVPPVFHRSDSQEQRAKMKELAKQRTKQLQEEEEERTKRQMAKSRAKLEELNKRTLATEESTQNVEKSTQILKNSSTGVVVQSKQDESHIPSESPKSGRRFVPESSKPNSVAQSNENSEQSLEPPKSVCEEPPAMPTQLLEVKSASSAHHDNAPQVHETNVPKQKRSGSKQKQPTSTTEAPKPLVENVTASPGAVAGEVVQSGVPNLPSETSAHPKKRSGKNGKNKHKSEDESTLSTTVPKESLANVSLETGQPKASSENQPNPSTAADRPSEQNPTSPNEDSHGIRGNSHWKPQHQSRKIPRSQQSNRTGGEKFHAGEAVVWAPVRSHHKPEVSDESSPKNVVDEIIPPAKSDNQAPNNSKNKRAEMERYVPKPVAKEMAQHGGIIQNPVAPVVNQTPMTDDSVPENSRKTGISIGPKNGNNRHSNNNNKQQHQQGKAHGLWRQRGPMEDGSSYSSNVTQNVLNPIEPEVAISAKGQEKYSDGWNDWGTSEDYVELVSIPTPVKDQGVGSRGKRHASKGHNKGSGNPRDHDQKKSFGDETEKSFAQSSNDHSAPNWQPKSQPPQANSQRGNMQNSGQNLVPEVSLENKPEPTNHRSISGNTEHVPNPRHLEPRRERKTAPPKGQGPSNPGESEPPANFEPRQSSSSSGFRKNGNHQNTHFSHSHEARGEWNNYSGQDNNKQHNREMRPRQNNQRYEYQPIGTSQNNNSKANNYFEGPNTEHSGGSGRGRGQNHSRRGGGNFHE